MNSTGAWGKTNITLLSALRRALRVGVHFANIRGSKMSERAGYAAISRQRHIDRALVAIGDPNRFGADSIAMRRASTA